MKKPHILRSGEHWLVVDGLTRQTVWINGQPMRGVQVSRILGVGSTVREAWRNAYPTRTSFVDIFESIFGKVPARDDRTDPCDILTKKPGGLPL